jgi:hypothetical protein
MSVFLYVVERCTAHLYIYQAVDFEQHTCRPGMQPAVFGEFGQNGILDFM